MKRLRLIREKRGLSLRALKKASSVAVSNLARYEAGQGDPRLGTVRKVAKALGVSVADLIGESKPGKGVKKIWD
jgi:transcriptional regulator with XRE-family HTH domain